MRSVIFVLRGEGAPPLWVEGLGWYGAIAVLAAYLLLSMEVIDQGLVYQLLNVTGAAGIFAISLAKKTWQPVALNVIWALIALVALLRMSF